MNFSKLSLIITFLNIMYVRVTYGSSGFHTLISRKDRLSFHKNFYTRAVKTRPELEMNCISSEKICEKSNVESVICKKDNNESIWECYYLPRDSEKNKYAVVLSHIVCEGYEGLDNDHIVDDSCYVNYEVKNKLNYGYGSDYQKNIIKLNQHSYSLKQVQPPELYTSDALIGVALIITLFFTFVIRLAEP